MPVTLSTLLKLDIPQSPETTDPEMFKELLRVYNSLQLIAENLNSIITRLDELQAGTPTLPPATDPTSTQDLVNALRFLLISVDIAS